MFNFSKILKQFFRSVSDAYLVKRLNFKLFFLSLPSKALFNPKNKMTDLNRKQFIWPLSTFELKTPVMFTNLTSKTNTFSKNPLTVFKSIKLELSLKINLMTTAIYDIKPLWASFSLTLLDVYKRTLDVGFIAILWVFCLCTLDANLADDEPIWEPVEWSLIQSWIMFIFLFSWIGENLITSRYGSYTGRDKRVWFSWYKTFWLLEGWYVISLGVAALFVITPFYHELTYSTPLIVSWWDWYTRVYFFSFTSVYTAILIIAYYLQINLRWLHWSKSFLLIVIISFYLFYLMYAHFFMVFFAYFTDVSWYAKTRTVDYVQLSHEPNKWSWGAAKRDHFQYHHTTTCFWFKNDGPFAAAFFFFHIFFFLALFFLNFFWVTLLRSVYVTREVTHTYTTYCVSSLKQFFFFFFLSYILVFFSFIFSYWRMPMEYFWISNNHSWFSTLWSIWLDYPSFMLSIFL